MIFEFSLKTAEEYLYYITSFVKDAINKSGISDGISIVFCPHTTAGITINENADPDVVTDLLYGLNEMIPNRTNFRHIEGNSSAHLKASCIGASETIIIKNSKPLLGRWQGIYFCEFDGPRQRSFLVKIIKGAD